MTHPSINAYLTKTEWLRAVYLWETGRDTFQIARALNVHQAFIHNKLPHYRRALKGVSEVDRAVNG